MAQRIFVPASSIEGTGDGFCLRAQDGSFLSTPGGAKLCLPTRSLAEVLFEECKIETKGKRDRAEVPGLGPFMQLAFTAIDLIAADKPGTIQGILATADADLLCHRASEPEILCARQVRVWQPYLDWCAKELNAPLQTGTGVMPIGQPQASLEALALALARFDAFHLVGIKETAAISHSCVLALALAFGMANALEIFEAAELDGTYALEVWGEDEELQRRRRAIKTELETVGLWFQVLKSK